MSDKVKVTNRKAAFELVEGDRFMTPDGKSTLSALKLKFNEDIIEVTTETGVVAMTPELVLDMYPPNPHRMLVAVGYGRQQAAIIAWQDDHDVVRPEDKDELFPQTNGILGFELNELSGDVWDMGFDADMPAEEGLYVWEGTIRSVKTGWEIEEWETRYQGSWRPATFLDLIKFDCVPELPQVSALPSLVQMNEAITEHALVIAEALGPSKSALEGIETVSAAQAKLKALVLQLYAAAIYPSDKRTERKMEIAGTETGRFRKRPHDETGWNPNTDTGPA